MSNQSELKALLPQLAEALQNGTIAEAGELYKRIETLSIGATPFVASKKHLMQVVRKYLMAAFGQEIMRVATSISDPDLARYDVSKELAEVIEKL